MGYYENIKCGKCKYSFTDGYRSSNGLLKTYMGIPYLKCPKCNTVNKTGLKPYSTFHIIEKVYHWFSFTLRSAIFGFMWSIPCTLIIALVASFVGMAVTDSVYEVKIELAYYTMPLISIIFAWRQIRGELKDIKHVEAEYNQIT